MDANVQLPDYVARVVQFLTHLRAGNDSIGSELGNCTLCVQNVPKYTPYGYSGYVCQSNPRKPNHSSDLLLDQLR